MEQVAEAVKKIFNFGGACIASFKIYPAEAHNSKLRDWVEMSGGVVLDPGEDDPYAIRVVDTHWYVEEKGILPPKKLPADHFTSSFIYKSMIRGKCLDLNNYRISESMYEDFDANLILRREIPWNELKGIAPGSKPRLQQNKFIRSSDSNNNASADHSRAKKPRVTAVDAEAARGRSPSVSSIESSDSSILMLNSTRLRSPIKDGWSSRKNKDANDTKNRSTGSCPTRDTTRNVSTEQSKPQDSDDEESGPPNEQQQIKKRNNVRIDDSSGDPRASNMEESSKEKQSKSSESSSKKSNDHPTGNQRPNSVPHRSSNSNPIVSVHKFVAHRVKLPVVRSRRDYTHREDQIILDYICKNKLHSVWKGMKMWHIMEGKKVLPGRTANSMKERFRRQIMKNLATYACSQEDIKELKNTELK